MKIMNAFAALILALSVGQSVAQEPSPPKFLKVTHTRAHCVAQAKSIYYSCLSVHRSQTTCARIYSEFVRERC